MEKADKIKALVSMGVIVLLAVVIVNMNNLFPAGPQIKAGQQITNLAIPSTADGDYSEGDYIKCLGDKGAIMYGAYWCSHCQNQKKTLGNSKYTPYVECDPSGDNAQPERCRAAGISGYPTWEINGKLYPGEQSIEQLEALTGCKLQ